MTTAVLEKEKLVLGPMGPIYKPSPCTTGCTGSTPGATGPSGGSHPWF